MKKGALVGQGRSAEVYKWGPDRVLKLFFDRDDDKIQYEARIGEVINEAGVPSPNVFDIVEVDGRKGIVFQRIIGKTMTSHVAAEPWKLCCYAEQMARFHYKIHKYSTDGLPSQKESFENKIGLSSEILGNKGKRILNYMKSLPDGNSICHGDIHFDNIIVSDKGLVAVDWYSAYKGNPLGDVARTCLMINLPLIFSEASDIIAMMTYYPRRLVYKSYLNEYMRLAKVRHEDIDAWILPVAAAKIKGKRNGESKWLMDTIDKYLDKYGV